MAAETKKRKKDKKKRKEREKEAILAAHGGTLAEANGQPTEGVEAPKEKKKRLRKWLEAIRQITLDDIKSGHGEKELFFNTVEELGEYAAASTVERGVKKKVLKESKKVESVDLIICAFSLFFADGGTLEELLEIGPEKLQKWEDRVKKKLAEQS